MELNMDTLLTRYSLVSSDAEEKLCKHDFE